MSLDESINERLLYVFMYNNPSCAPAAFSDFPESLGEVPSPEISLV